MPDKTANPYDIKNYDDAIQMPFHRAWLSWGVVEYLDDKAETWLEGVVWAVRRAEKLDIITHADARRLLKEAARV